MKLVKLNTYLGATNWRGGKTGENEFNPNHLNIVISLIIGNYI
jgi:hypothetical protein